MMSPYTPESALSLSTRRGTACRASAALLAAQFWLRGTAAPAFRGADTPVCAPTSTSPAKSTPQASDRKRLRALPPFSVSSVLNPIPIARQLRPTLPPNFYRFAL